MDVKILNKSGKITRIENALKIEITFDMIDSLMIDDNRITYIEGQISQNEEKKWQTLLP